MEVAYILLNIKLILISINKTMTLIICFMVFITTEVCQTSNSINKAMQQFKDEEKQENLWRKKQYALYISQPERIKVCDVSIATDFIHCDIGNSKYLENELQQNLSKPSHMISVSIHLCVKRKGSYCSALWSTWYWCLSVKLVVSLHPQCSFW